MVTDRLTAKGKRALALARNEALFFQQEQIQPEHILAALAGMPQCLAFHLLLDLVIDLHLVVREIVTVSGFGRPGEATPDPKLSALSLQALARADDEARDMGAKATGTEHILLGLIREESLASYVLSERLGIRIEEVRRRVADQAANEPQQGPQTGA